MIETSIKILYRSVRLIFVAGGIGLFALLTGCGGADSSTGGRPNPGVEGKAGSMSRFALSGDYLYTIGGGKLQLFTLAADPARPNFFANIAVNPGVETLFVYNNHLFVGATNGVYIYDNFDEENPTFVSQVVHATSCDPVVVSGDYAYVTLRSDAGRCGQTARNNRLEVIDISNINEPVVVKSYAMVNPKGLGVDNGLLFVCDDVAGLKIYNNANPIDMAAPTIDSSVNCYDLIAYQNRLVVSDNTGILQYGYENLSLSKLSHIEVQPGQ